MDMLELRVIYKGNDDYFDVTDVTMKYFLKTDRLVIPHTLNINNVYGDPHRHIKKELILYINNNKYNFVEHLCKLNKTVSINIPSDIIKKYKSLSNLYGFTARYGVGDNLSIDVTNSIIRYFIKNNSIIIDKKTNFDKYFGGVFNNKPKYLTININNKDTTIVNNPDNEIIINLIDNKVNDTKSLITKQVITNSNNSSNNNIVQKKVLILGKGPTAINIKKNEYPDHIIVGINHAILMIDEIDYFFLNDIESLNGIPEDKFNHIKTIVLPEFPHKDKRAMLNITYKNVIEKIKNKDIKVEIFNLFTSPRPNNNLIKIVGVLTTSDTAIKYLTMKYNYKHFDLYGICKGSGYHKSISSNIPEYNQNCGKAYNDRRLNSIKKSIIKLKNDYGLTITFN